MRDVSASSPITGPSPRERRWCPTGRMRGGQKFLTMMCVF